LNGKLSNGNHSNGSAARPSNGANGARTAKSSAPSWSKNIGHGSNGNGSNKAGAKPNTSARSASAARNGSAIRKETRADARPTRNGRKPALTAGAKAGNSKRYGFTARPKAKLKPKQESKKRA
jgi:hypothetical protein